ncbi:NB-ARC domains-containing protein, partial [Tanacetum coccineum]
MSGWEVWSTNSGVVDAAFPRLQELEIRCCPNLVKVSFEALPSMRVLDLIDCGDGVLTSLIHVASAVTKLSIWSISGLSDEVWRGVMDYLGAVEEVSIFECNEIRYLWESEAKASKVLVNLRKLEVSKVIFQSIGGENKEFADLKLLQADLKIQLTGKRFLLVLDDIWSDKLEDWETLAAPFFEVARGSKIIITTRKKELLRQLGHKCPHDLQKLSHNDAFSLFARHAGISDFESYPTLRLHGEGIVKKCDGLPLALKALGSLLRTKTDEEDWKQLLTEV